MNKTNDAFRAQYRAGISRFYSASLHAGFVFAWGLAASSWLMLQVQAMSALVWLAIPTALLFFNLGEYTVHKQLGHIKKPWSRLFYQRHTGDHHSFFVPGRLHYEYSHDWRVILFPPWLVVVFSVLLVAPTWWLLGFWDANVAAVFAATLMMSYLSYEFFHAVAHLPDSHWLTRVPGLAYMKAHHALHHERDVMTQANFSIVFPFADWLFSTWHKQQKARK